MNKQRIRSAAAWGLVVGLAGLVGSAPVRAEEDNDMKIWRESVEERLRELHNEVSDFNNIRMDFFTDLRGDYETLPSQNTPGSNAGKGSSGFYNRRAEAKFYGKVQPNVTASVGFDFTELKLKDAGIQIDELPLIPFFDGGPELSVRLGQFRMPFGIETQTSSSAIWFAERSFLNGGAGGTKLIGERAMGFQGKTMIKTGVVDLDLAAGGFNMLSKDQESGKNNLFSSFGGLTPPSQVFDQDLSYVGRLGLDLAFAKGFLPEKSKLVLGGSYGRDSQNTVWRAQNNNIKYQEVVGADLLFNLGRQTKLQAEWVSLGTFTGPNTVAYREAYYGQAAFDVLPLFSSEIAKGDALELLARIEQEKFFNSNGAVEKDRLAFGLKSSYWGGKNHTALNYYITAPNGQYGGTKAGGPDQLIVLQQQIAFESGKPRWMEKLQE